MKKPLLILLILFLSYPTTNAQNCASLEEWNTIISAEFPKVDTYHIRSGSVVSNRILYNLYSDKYFVPFAGKPYDKISTNAGKSISKKLKKCRAKKKYQSLKNIGWLSMFGVEPLTNPRITENVKAQSTEVNKIRAEYNQLLSLFTSGGVTFNELTKYKNMAKTRFVWLMPSEVENYLNVISESENKIANTTLLSLANELTQKNANLLIISNIENFESNNRSIYAAASPHIKKEVAEILKKDKITKLEMLVKNEQKKLNQISSSDKNINTINNYYKSFDGSFSRYRQYNFVKNHFEAIKIKKTDIVTAMSSKIGLTILSQNELSKLKNINTTYLSNVTENSPVITVLKKQLTTKENSIKQAQKIAAEKALAQKRAAEQIFTIAENKRQQTINNHKNRVVQLRKELRVEHGSNLPKFEALHVMLFYYLKLVKDNKMYKVKDAEFFIRHVENTGYMREETGTISPFENFYNRSGFKIRASSIVGRTFASIELTIPNASKKMIELYSKELVSEFRNIDKTIMTPSIMPTAKDNYILSGGTQYSLKVDAKGTLILEAMENRELAFPMLADKLQVDTWSVSSLKTVTDVAVKKGQEVTITASGKVKVGDFMGSVSPAGISGYGAFSIDKRYNHGALMARIGSGSWTYIGTRKTFTANKSGILYFKINDKFPDNNEGEFKVKYFLK
ncbi:hypothetical protein [Aureibaculum luteum]|uniref:hypothetical protein n=1 Tax=Aureibaculum luteum TaxID=1548456 RepID=UPI000E51BE7F|nr:hypothetical protein [Aureibaculum luteum]